MCKVYMGLRELKYSSLSSTKLRSVPFLGYTVYGAPKHAVEPIWGSE